MVFLWFLRQFTHCASCSDRHFYCRFVGLRGCLENDLKRSGGIRSRPCVRLALCRPSFMGQRVVLGKRFDDHVFLLLCQQCLILRFPCRRRLSSVPRNTGRCFTPSSEPDVIELPPSTRRDGWDAAFICRRDGHPAAATRDAPPPSWHWSHNTRQTFYNKAFICIHIPSNAISLTCWDRSNGNR